MSLMNHVTSVSFAKVISYFFCFRYAKAAAQKLTQTVIETAIKGGGGIVQTLKKSYSMNDLNNLGEEDTKKVILQQIGGDVFIQKVVA